MIQETKKDKEIKDEDTEEVLPHIPAPKVSRFGNQQSKF